MPITLKQMRYAVAVSRTGHFGRAADACAVTQPALSQQIQALEQICGSPLFDRLKSGVRTTPFGQEFVALAQHALKGADAVSSFALERSGHPQRPVRFGLIPTVAPYLLPEIFPSLIRDMPAVSFAVSENRTDALIAGLIDGSLDVALIGTAPPEHGPKLAHRALFKDDFVLATSSAERFDGPVSLANVPAERILLLDEGHCFRDQTIAACKLDSTRGTHTFAATSLSTIVEFVANGQGVTLLPQIALRKEGNDKRIAIHPIVGPGTGRQLSLVWRQATPFARTFDKMADVICATRPPEA